MTQVNQSRFLRPLLITLLVLIALLAATPGLDESAESNYQNAFKRALVTFALARTLNGVISVAQGTELALQPAGVGVTLTPGEILDPLNDLIERFSWVMLAASTSLGAQHILLKISHWWGLRLLVVVLAALLVLLYVTRKGSKQFRPALIQVFLMVLFLRFAVPLVMLANDAIYTVFLQPEYETATETIRLASDELEELNEKKTAGEEVDESLLGAVSRAFDNTMDQVRIRERMKSLKDKSAAIVEQLIQLSVVFLLQTIVLPLLFLYLLVKIFKRLLQIPKPLLAD